MVIVLPFVCLTFVEVSSFCLGAFSRLPHFSNNIPWYLHLTIFPVLKTLFNRPEEVIFHKPHILKNFGIIDFVIKLCVCVWRESFSNARYDWDNLLLSRG